MAQTVAPLPPSPTRFAAYIDWAIAQDLGPYRLAELDGPWPVTVTYMRAPPGEMRRPREAFHDLFISLRPLELWEQSGGRRRRYQFRRGTVGFTNAGSNWHVSWNGQLEGFGFLFADAVLRRAMGADGENARWRLALSDHAPAIGFLGIEIANHVFAGFPDGREHVDHLLGTFLAMAARRYGTAPERDPLKLGRHHPQVQRAILYIEEHLANRFGLDEVCRAADISVAHLNRSFQAELGTSVWQYVKARRLEKAHALVSDTLQPIASVATACGFGSTAHFTNAFRDRYGVAPSALRQQPA
jgi:AraC-like DNA-binding protein